MSQPGVNIPMLVKAMGVRRIDAAHLAQLTGYKPETVAAYIAGTFRAPHAFGVAAEKVLRLKPGQLELEP